MTVLGIKNDLLDSYQVDHVIPMQLRRAGVYLRPHPQNMACKTNGKLAKAVVVVCAYGEGVGRGSIRVSTLVP